MHEQHRQQQPLLGATERQRAVFIDHLQWPQDSKFDHRLRPTGQRYHRTLIRQEARADRGVYQP